jgi:hypothetical protein
MSTAIIGQATLQIKAGIIGSAFCLSLPDCSIDSAGLQKDMTSNKFRVWLNYCISYAHKHRYSNFYGSRLSDEVNPICFFSLTYAEFVPIQE